jgi:hypothetical protein
MLKISLEIKKSTAIKNVFQQLYDYKITAELRIKFNFTFKEVKIL